MRASVVLDPILDPAPPFTRVLRSLTLLAVSGASVVLGWQTISMGSHLPAFVASNEIPRTTRTLVILTTGAGAVLPPAIALFALAIWRARALERIEVASKLLAPMAALALLAVLFRPEAWHDKTLDFLVLLSFTGALVGVTSQIAIEAAQSTWPRLYASLSLERERSRWAALAVVILASASYAAYTGYLTILDLHRLIMGGYDMGFFDSQMSNSLHGHFFRNTIMYGPEGGNSIAGHAQFAHLLFLPFYALYPGSEFLLAVQAVFVGFAAIPLFLFAETQVPRADAVVVSLAYLLFAPLHGAQFYDFHWLTMDAPFFFWMFYGIATQRRWLVAITAVLICLLREDMAPGLAMLGVFLMVVRFRPRLGAALSAMASLWFILDKFVIMPAAGQWWFADIYKDLVAPGESGYGSIIKTLILNPAYAFTTLLTRVKLVYALHLFAPLAFLPLRRLSLTLLAVAPALLTLVTTQYDAATSIYFQYPGHWVPYLFGGSVLALRVVRKESGSAAAAGLVAALALSSVAHSNAFGVLFRPVAFQGARGMVRTSMSAQERADYSALRHLIALIPRNASVAATEWEVPLITNRVNGYSAALHYTEPDYVLIHRDHFVTEAKPHLIQLFSSKSYGLVEHIDRAYLFRRGAPTPVTEPALRELGLKP